uniref:mitochondrial import inner membrane translocase subunit TIM10-like isoform X1 n=1 Tax=Erigeron canadensis TaxID=72917 RepID=UPI001CB8E97E|nr:mitochondrial import inner membrane translocase subunit TIM10-like isoform X1 [Erigeron canadensis]
MAANTNNNNNNMSVEVNREQIFGMAEKEMEYRVELFNKLTQTCFAKCVERRYKEPELNLGETSCIDRCVSKYWQFFARILSCNEYLFLALGCSR